MELNADLGEGEPIEQTRALMRVVHSANIACGGHAGTADSMEAAVRSAMANGVRIGAHPGFPDRADFGRQIDAARAPGAGDLELILLLQVGALEVVCRRFQTKLHHLKLHGALYHLTESVEALGEGYLRTVERYWPGTIIYGLAGGRLARRAKAMRLPFWHEAFLDRAYQANGQLVPRGQAGAILRSMPAVLARLRKLAHNGRIKTVAGTWIALQPDTLCVHGDTPGALKLARRVRAELERVGAD